MGDTNLLIRDAALDDAAPLAVLLARVFTTTYGMAIPPLTLAAYLKHAFVPTRIAEEIQTVPHLVAVSGGAIIGVSKITHRRPAGHQFPDAVELERLYIDERFHGRGVAGSLLEHTFATSRTQGYTTIWLCVWERNERALAFYRKHGFEPFGRTPIFVDTIEFNDMLMRRTIDDY